MSQFLSFLLFSLNMLLTGTTIVSYSLKNMCSETKPAGSGSATVISSSHLLWPALDGKWQEVCCVRKLGDITLCVCVRARLHSSID